MLIYSEKKDFNYLFIPEREREKPADSALSTEPNTGLNLNILRQNQDSDV